MFEALRSRALEHLSLAWPATLQGWDVRDEVARAFEYETGKTMYPSPIVSPFKLARVYQSHIL
jgi:hypothetical protein